MQTIVHKSFNEMNRIRRYFLGGKNKNKNDANAGAYVISFPKCGRTWLRILLGKVLCEKFDIDSELMLDTINLTRAAKILPTVFTHDGSSIREGRRYDTLETDKSKYRGKKVVFLIRDPRDVMVSCYFQAVKRIHKYQGTISDFIRTDKYGIKKYLTFLNIWFENQKVPKDFLLLRYEDLQINPSMALKLLLDFLDVKTVENKVIKNAVNFGSFNNMKKLEKKGFFKNKIMQPSSNDDDESYKVRKGKVGGYIDYLSNKDIEFTETVITEMKCPFWINK